MIPLKYTYLIGAVISFVPWLILYMHRKDLRGEMVTMSVLVAAMGLISNYFWWTEDWWRPLTITATRIGIEDIVLGFSTGGIAAVPLEDLVFYFLSGLFIAPFYLYWKNERLRK